MPYDIKSKSLIDVFNFPAAFDLDSPLLGSKLCDKLASNGVFYLIINTDGLNVFIAM